MLYLRGPLVQLKDFCNRNFLKESHDEQIRPQKFVCLFLSIKTEILLLSH